MNFPAEIKWIGDDVIAVSETVDLGSERHGDITVRLSAYASRVNGRFGLEYRYFGNYQLMRDDKVLSDQRGLDVVSLAHLQAMAARAVLALSGGRSGSAD